MLFIVGEDARGNELICLPMILVQLLIKLGENGNHGIHVYPFIIIVASKRSGCFNSIEFYAVTCTLLSALPLKR